MMEHNPSLEDRVKELARLLGIAVGEQLHRALEVGEKDGEAKPIATPGADPGSPFRADVQQDPWIGQAINARYQVSRRLAAGPSGTLYIAHDGETGAEVTLKLLPVGIALNDEGSPASGTSCRSRAPSPGSDPTWPSCTTATARRPAGPSWCWSPSTGEAWRM